MCIFVYDGRVNQIMLCDQANYQRFLWFVGVCVCVCGLGKVHISGQY